jgi:hypothetical protein
MEDIKAQNTAILDFFAVLNPQSLLLKDALGNVDLLKGKLEAEGVVAGAFTVKIVDPDAKTIGENAIHIYRDADGDGKDDNFPGNDGKSIIVKTKSVSKNSRIFVTPKITTSEPLAVIEIKEGESFTVSVKSAVSEEVSFDWFIVEEKETVAPSVSVPESSAVAPIVSEVQ